jgi:hypothetical protein
MNIKDCEAWLNEQTGGMLTTLVASHMSNYVYLSLPLSYILFIVDGCTLSNNLAVGVHNIPKERLLTELDIRIHTFVGTVYSGSVRGEKFSPARQRTSFDSWIYFWL